MDGTMNLLEYQDNLKQQKSVITHITQGNNSLNEFDKYNSLLHQQWIIEVTGNNEHNKSLRGLSRGGASFF